MMERWTFRLMILVPSLGIGCASSQEAMRHESPMVTTTEQRTSTVAAETVTEPSHNASPQSRKNLPPTDKAPITSTPIPSGTPDTATSTDQFFQEQAAETADWIINTNPSLISYVVQEYGKAGVAVRSIPEAETAAYTRRHGFIKGNPSISPNIHEAILSGKVVIGMTPEQVKASLGSLEGEGNKIMRRTDASGEKEVWEWKEVNEKYATNMLLLHMQGRIWLMNQSLIREYGHSALGKDVPQKEKHTWDMIRATFNDGKVTAVEHFPQEE